MSELSWSEWLEDAAKKGAEKHPAVSFQVKEGVLDIKVPSSCGILEGRLGLGFDQTPQALVTGSSTLPTLASKAREYHKEAAILLVVLQELGDKALQFIKGNPEF